MKAVRLHEYGGPEKLVFENDVPEPQVKDDQVLVEASAASVNPIDWKIRSGARQKDFPLSLPAILGRDLSGVVSAVGKSIRSFKAGDRVLGMHAATYAEFVAVPEGSLTHLPDGVDLIDASSIPLVVLTGDQLVRLATQVRSGETVIVSGALGSVGRAAVHSAMKLGARVIAAVRKRQLAEAERLGTEVIAVDDDEALERLTPVDCVADTVGNEVAAKLLAKIKPGGRLGYASVFPDGASAANPSVKITRVFAKPDASKLREFADDVRDGKFLLPISRRLPLRDAAQAHALAENGGVAGKVLLVVS